MSEIKITSKPSGWKTLYGWKGDYLKSTMEAQDFERLRAEFLEIERQRMRQVMKARRERLKAENVERLKGTHGRLPNYPDRLLLAIERWIDDHHEKTHESAMPLMEIESAIRKYCRLKGFDDYDRVTSKGIGQYCRAIGLPVIRRIDGMWVKGLWIKPKSAKQAEASDL